MTMGYTMLKTSLILLVVHQMRRTAASLSSSYVSPTNTDATNLVIPTVNTSYSNPNSTVNPVPTSINVTDSTMIHETSAPSQTQTLSETVTNAITATTTSYGFTGVKPSLTSRRTIISTTATKTLTSGSVAIIPSSPSRTSFKTSSPGGGKTKRTDDDSEPKTSLYIWEIVACGAGAFVFLLFIIIGILCYQNKILRKRVKAVGSYTLPIKENGAWIDNQDIPLWQKRASTYNAQENPVQDNPAVEESEAT